MIHTTLRPTAPTTLLFALLLAVTAFAALAGMASATPVSGPAGKYDPNGFADSCNQLGGTPTEDLGPGAVVLVSYCTFDNGTENTCNWVSGVCTYSYVPEPSGKVVGPPLNGVLVDDTPAPKSGFGGVVAPSRQGGAVLTTAP
jgi:hypothetical protein